MTPHLALLRFRLALVCVLTCPLACGDEARMSTETGADDDGTGTAAAGTDDASAGSDDALASTGGAVEAEITYWTDIKPLLDGRCNTCHDDGGIAPFPLTSYDGATQYAPSAVPAVQARTMPPWPPNDECAEHVGNRSLTDAQIELFSQWVEAGMPEGDPDSEGQPMDPVSPGLPRVDLTMQMPEPYVPVQSPDDYRCFLLPWTEETTKFVTGFRAVPGNGAIVHHVIAFLAGEDDVDAYLELDAAEDGPGYTCFGGTGGPSRTWLGGWAPGGQGTVLADGLGMRVEPGSMIVLQVHYNALDTDVEPDSTSIDLMLEDVVEREARVVPFTNPAWVAGAMQIPAGDADVVHEFTTSLGALAGAGVDIYSSALHMHMLGSSGRLSVVHADGSEDCLLQIDDWDFSWQGSYGYPQPHRIEPTDEVKLQCRFDNSVGNQPFVGGETREPRDVGWGEGTTDEMCLGVLLVATDEVVE
jgi:hypothetical protein